MISASSIWAHTTQSAPLTAYRFTTAKEHDSKRIDELVENEDKVVLADRGYASRARRETLQKRGVIDAIIYKRNRGQKRLADWQIEWNRIVSRARAPNIRSQ